MKYLPKRIYLVLIVLISLPLCSKLMAAASAFPSVWGPRATYRAKTISESLPLSVGNVVVCPYAVSEEVGIRVIMGTTKIPEGDTGPFSKPSISMITGQLAFDGRSHPLNEAADRALKVQTNGLRLVLKESGYAFVNEDLGLDITATRQEVVKMEFPSVSEYWIYFLDFTHESPSGTPFEGLDTLVSAMNKKLSGASSSGFSVFSALPLDFARSMMVRDRDLGNSLAFTCPRQGHSPLYTIEKVSLLKNSIAKLEEETHRLGDFGSQVVYADDPQYGRNGGFRYYDISLSSADVVEATKSFLGKLTTVSSEMNTQHTFLRTLESDVRTRLAALRENPGAPVALREAGGGGISDDPDPSAGAAAAASSEFPSS